MDKRTFEHVSIQTVPDPTDRRRRLTFITLAGNYPYMASRYNLNLRQGCNSIGGKFHQIVSEKTGPDQ
ncbi:hypothetical protein N7481_000963 [Penicillium waksmanii]|uniref:uncharacterized protein n=1 Tax=Penicillium waksmanii TaxID=69791 RepID=UPI002548AB4E|nr:uncharacterized protein N7481_000963 [Penicillium waksmanii]KAJ6000554.1 hypothetical protein N7481_000963 [Penicillium waksmanii]